MKGLIDGFTIFGFNIKFYGIIMALAMLLGVVLACRNARHRNMQGDNIYTLALFVLPFAVIGARLFYVLGSLSERTYTFMQVIALWEGGMSIYGGIIGGALAIVLYCVVFKKNFFDVADVVCVSLILGQAIGRWGNFFNQEVYGAEITNSAGQWFPFGVLLNDGTWHYALFFYEFLINLAIFVVLEFILKKAKQKGVVAGTYLISYGSVRFLLEPLRMQEYNLMFFGMKLSSITSVVAVLAGIVILMFAYTNYRRRKLEGEQK